MLNNLARIISFVFHPLLIPTYFLLIIFNSENYLAFTSPGIQKVLYITFFSILFVVPISLLPLLVSLNIIKSYEVENSQERVMPLFFVTMIFIGTYYFLFRIPLPISLLIKNFLFGSMISVFAAMTISYFWKISAHLIGFGGFVAALIEMSIEMQSDFIFYIILVIFAAGLSGFARLQTNAHKPSQLYAGFGLGFVIMFTVMWIF